MIKVPPGLQKAGLLSLLLVLLSACAAPATPTTPSGRAPAGGQVAAEQPRARKVMTIAVQREPVAFGDLAAADSSTTGGASNVELIPHENLVAEKDLETYFPMLAAELPSVERGTWKVNPDGTMETIWKLRPNVKWHDGTPFTAQDLVFTFEVHKDPDMPKPRSGAVALMESTSAPDPHTFVIQWAKTYVNADHDGPGTIIPRHLLENAFRQDKTSLITSPLFTADFVGLGPYKLVRWERGSLIEFARFDDYYQGRAPLDALVVRFVGDSNTMVANILSATVDVVLPTGIDLEAALEVKRRWEGTGNQVRADNTGRLRHLEIQGRQDLVRPRNGLTNPNVRQALYRALDRNTLVGTITDGLAPVADSWIPPTHALRRQLEPSIPDFSYNVPRAQELFTQAGWVRGADGVMAHQPSGERFEVEIWGRQGDGSERELNIIADNWKAVGVQSTINVVPTARLSDREYGSTYSGFHIVNPSGDAFTENRLHSALVAGPANRWTGRNRSGYVNPRVDNLLDQLQVTIGQADRLRLHQQLLQEQMGDVALMPLFWEVVPVLMLKGIKGPKAVRNESTHNIFEWDKES